MISAPNNSFTNNPPLLDEWNNEILFIETISSYLDGKERIEYRGVNLKSAVSRHLYYMMCNDDSFRGYITDVNGGRVKPTYFFSSMELVEIAEYIKSKKILKCKIVFIRHLKIISKLKHMLKLSLGYKIFINLRNLFFRKKCSKNLDILIYSSGKKFTRQFNFLDGKKYTAGYLVFSRSDAARVGVNLRDAIIPQLCQSNSVDLNLHVWASIINCFDRLEQALLTYRPRLILYYEGDSVHHELLALIGRKYQIPSVCLQWGSFPFPGLLNGFRNLSCNYFFSWGELFTKQLRPFNPMPKFIATGHQGLVENIKSEEQKSIVFLLNTGGSLPAVGFNSFNQIFFDLIISVAENHSNKKILVRPHPNIPISPEELKILSNYRNVNIDYPDQVSLSSTLSKSFVAIGFTSSTLIEATACGVIPIVLNPFPWRYQPYLEDMGIGSECKNVEAVQTYLRKLIDDDGIFLKKIRKNLLKTRSKIFRCIGNESAEIIRSNLDSIILNG